MWHLALLFMHHLLLPIQAPTTVEEVENAALAHRRSIRTAYVVTNRLTGEGSEPASRRKSESTFWMDGDRLRADHVNHDTGLGVAAGKRQVEGINCERQGYVLQYQDIPRVAARLTPRGQANDFPVEATFDPRLLGYCSGWFGHLRTGRLDAIVGAADRTNLRIERSDLEGITCWVVRYESGSGRTTGRIWYDPVRGYHPVRFEVKTSVGKEKKSASATTRITLQKAGELWYPRTIVYEQNVGERITGTERVEVTDVKLNHEIPARVFTLAGIGIPNDTHFGIEGERPRDWVWWGGRLVTYAEYQKALHPDGVPVTSPVPLESGSSQHYWLYVLAGAFVIVAVVLIRRSIRQRVE